MKTRVNENNVPTMISNIQSENIPMALAAFELLLKTGCRLRAIRNELRPSASGTRRFAFCETNVRSSTGLDDAFVDGQAGEQRSSSGLHKMFRTFGDESANALPQTSALSINANLAVAADTDKQRGRLSVNVSGQLALWFQVKHIAPNALDGMARVDNLNVTAGKLDCGRLVNQATFWFLRFHSALAVGFDAIPRNESPLQIR